MASFSYSVDDQVFGFMLEAFCQAYGYQEKIAQDGVEIDNPESKAAFTLKCIEQFINAVVEGYKQHLGDQAKARHLTNVHRVLGDVQKLGEALPNDKAAFDLAYLRWVLCFVKSPEDVVRGLAAVVKPGGRVAIQDYFNYEYSIKIAPRRATFEKAIDAVATSWRSHGGDPDIVGRLPAMLIANGFEIRSMDVVQRVARSPAAFPHGGADSMWHWPDTFFKTFLPKLVPAGFLSQHECDAALLAWHEASNDPAAFVLMPSVFEIVAVRQ